jgi:hypothetical protein
MGRALEAALAKLREFDAIHPGRTINLGMTAALDPNRTHHSLSLGPYPGNQC